MNISIRNCIVLLFTAFIGTATKAQVVVNEFCTANYSDWNQGSGFEDWIEFYNPTGSTVNIGGYWLSNKLSNPQKWQLPAGTTVNANSYLVILLSGTFVYNPNMDGYLNSNFRVTQTGGDALVFSNTSGTILESFDIPTMGAFQANHSYGRTSDGAATWGIFTNPTQNAANTGTAYTAYTSKPQLSEQAGYKSGPINVSCTAAAGATLYYTLDGSEPTNASTPYSGPISISTTTTLRVVSYSPNPTELPSLLETNTYFFGDDHHNTMYVCISGATLSDGAWWGGGELTHIEFFTPDGTFITEATGDSNEHGNDSNGYPQKGFDYITRDAMGYDNEVQYPVFHTSDRPSYERLIFKAAANDNYPSSGDGAHIRDAYVHTLSELGNLHLDERKTEFCIVYINAQYWGVYDCREKVDDTDYTKYYYNQPDGFVDYLQTWGGTWNAYGSGTDWYTLVNFITTNDMTNQANYDYVLTQYNHMSLIDYFILNGYAVCTDWLNWNTSWWRGRNPSGGAKKWRYALWDNDATFGHYINYTGVPSTQPDADPCQIEGMGDVGGQGHIPVLNALFNNESFFADYIQRYASLSNTIFSCDRMIEVLDSMANVFEPEMTRHCTRWGGTYAGWQANLQTMRDFIQARCNDQIITGIEGCYDVTPFQVTIQMEGTGQFEFATLPFNETNLPFTGTYFADLPINMIAITDGQICGNFAGWEITSGTGVIADPSNPETTLTISSDVTIVAHFTEPTSGPITIVTDVSMPGAGVIEVNGTPQISYPYSTSQNSGDLLTLATTQNEWFTFNHWESVHTTLLPDDQQTTITLTPCVSDTVIAVFDYIDHFFLDVNVGLDGGGIVLMNGDTVTMDHITLDLLGGEQFPFTAVPSDQWSEFDHWEINGNTITPDNLTANIILTLIENGTITAIFNVTPHHTITVQVEPRFTGTVIFDEVYLTGNPYMTDDAMTVELEGNKPLEFIALPNEFRDFSFWKGKHAIPDPDQEAKTVHFTFTHSDTIVAHFQNQPFNIYIPNSFTPNNDGINDVFRVEGNAIDPDTYHLMIFDRWGQKVFESTDLTKVWEGDFNGGEYYVRDSFFQYVLKAKSVFELDVHEYTGSVMVVR